MLDTITLHISGRNRQDFKLNEACFRKANNERNETDMLFNTFYSKDNKQAIYVCNNLKQNYALLQCSIPKLLYGNSLQNVNLQDTEKLEGILRNRLKGIFETDFLNSNISRLDITQNIETENEIPLYVYGLKEAYEQSGRYRVETFSNETLTIKNNSRQFLFYDKVKEALANKDISRQEGKAYGNILRYEVRHKKAKHVKTSFGKVYTLNEVLTQDFFDKAKEFQLRTFENLFRNAGNYELFMQDLNIMEVVARYSKKNLLKNFVIKSMTDKHEVSHDWKHYENLLQLQGMKRAGRQKALREMKAILKLGKTSQSDILEELKTKLAG